MNTEQTMILPETSLVKYKNPVRMTDKVEKLSRVLEQESKKSLVDRMEVSFDPRNVCKMETTDSILRCIMPPRKIRIGKELFVQEVSSSPASRIEVVQLTRMLNQQLEVRGAKMTGICPVRRELFSQVFDELIRQLTIHCAERGLLLLRVRNEVATTILALQSIYASGVVFGLQKSLAREADRNRQENRITQLEAEIEVLNKRIKIEALNCTAVEEKEANRLAAATRRAEEDVNFLRKGHEQLKSQLEDILNQFKLVSN